jgi:16S rRNA (guanine966-N2)-methyltransferase
MSPLKRNRVRIIGGQWRSRVISFPASEGLRPTPDRVGRRYRIGLVKR